jgi:hypothetical protein
LRTAPGLAIATSLASIALLPLGGTADAVGCPTASSGLSGAGTDADPYRITSANDLVLLAEDESLLDASFLQTADIDLAGCDWNPIGGRYDAQQTTFGPKFTGTYDGDDHTIANLAVTTVDPNRGGLFGRVETAELRDLRFTGATIDASASDGFTGILVGEAEGSTISGIEITDSTVTASGAAGAVVGSAYTARQTMTDLSDLTVSDSVSVSGAPAGGVIGRATYDGGGLDGTESLTIRSIRSGATVGGSSSKEVGGLAGFVDTQGTVTITDVDVSGDATTSGDMAGGLIGQLFTRSPFDITITDVRAAGDATATTRVGGLIGYIWSNPGVDNSLTIRRALATGDVTAREGDAGGAIGLLRTFRGPFALTEVGTTGSVTAGTSKAGGLVGAVDTWAFSETDPASLTITDSYALGDVNGDTSVGGMIGDVYTQATGKTVSIVDSFASGAVSATTSGDGSLIGTADTPADVIITDTFWDDDTNGSTSTLGGSGLPTSSMTTAQTFVDAGWSVSLDALDSDATWGGCEGFYLFHMWAADAATAACRPGAPSDVIVDGIGGTATVAWSAAPVVGSEPVQAYTVTAAPGGATCTVDAPDTSCTLAGLTIGTEFRFSVVASNAVGPGEAATSEAFVMSAAPTTVPTTVPPTVPAVLPATGGDIGAAPLTAVLILLGSAMVAVARRRTV